MQIILKQTLQYRLVLGRMRFNLAFMVLSASVFDLRVRSHRDKVKSEKNLQVIYFLKLF